MKGVSECGSVEQSLNLLNILVSLRKKGCFTERSSLWGALRGTVTALLYLKYHSILLCKRNEWLHGLHREKVMRALFKGRNFMHVLLPAGFLSP